MDHKRHGAKTESLPPAEPKGSKGSLIPSYLPLTGESVEGEKIRTIREQNVTVEVTEQTYGSLKSTLQHQQSLI